MIDPTTQNACFKSFTARATVMAAFVLATVLACCPECTAESDEFEPAFTSGVLPFLQTYCLDCHQAEEPAAQLDLTRFKTVDDVRGAHAVWKTVLDRVAAGEMPPADASPRPEDQQAAAVVEWIRALRQHEAAKNAGDPGVVLVRRLSNAEYNNTIRELTGYDLQPTRSFPIDPANEAGFDNSGESLTMSPGLVSRYLKAAQAVAEHLVLTPSDLHFAPHPVVTFTDRDKYCVKRIVEFYERQPTDLADYFYVCWQYQHQSSPGQPADQKTIEQVATEAGVSPHYARMVWQTLQQPASWGPLQELQTRFAALQSVHNPETARDRSGDLREYVKQIRPVVAPRFDNLNIDGIHKGAQAFVLWKNRQYAAHRRRFDPATLYRTGEDLPDDFPAELVLPQDKTAKQSALQSLETFCSVFPDAFFISERGRDYLNVPREKQEKGRLLSAGFHSMMGYFRDDAPLCELILDDAQRSELDRLWLELDCVASVPTRQYAGFLWFERTDSRYMRDPQFDFARPENKEAASAAMIQRLEAVYLEKARRSSDDETALGAIRDYFTEMNARIRNVEYQSEQAEPTHRRQLVQFAAQAWRRPLEDSEQQAIEQFYWQLREADGLTHEDAMRDSVVSILTSPHFLYRLDLAAWSDASAPLTGAELASRLSYVLWAAPPDAELMRAFLTENGRPPQVEIIRQQTERMLRDDRVRGMATEFAANWLNIRQFEQHNSVDRSRFPQFTDDLRRAMFEEPVRFFTDVAQHDRSVLDFIAGTHTFVNSTLAEHYGMPAGQPRLNPGTWQLVQNADAYHRGGLLPMAVFMTANSPGLRTSPVKRGYWVVKQLLGERIPPPPPDVPELPADESQPDTLSLPEMLARHRDHASCAGCHDRFDAIGLAFEGFGPVGESRQVDLASRPVQDTADFPDNVSRTGLNGLREYVQTQRRDDFIDNLCRKLLTYALGRSLILTDEPLLAELKQQLVQDQYRFHGLIHGIVTSRQFLNKRGPLELAIVLCHS
jgi:mono/diheme cytochrome c family protein